MHGFRDNEVLLQAVFVIFPLGALQVIFHYGFWKSKRDLLIVFHSNVSTGMHGLRDNEVLLPTGNDVIVISPLEGVSHRFCWRPRFHNHGSLTYFAYLLPFRNYSTFILGWYLPIPTNFRGVLGQNTPKFKNYTFLIPNRDFLTPDRVFLSYCARKFVHGYGL